MTFISCELYFQDTLKSSLPENKVMKKANTIAISTMTLFFLMCGCLGYAAFGNDARGNMLTGFGFYEPFWLIDLGNIMIVVHLLGSYQVLSFKHSKSMLNFILFSWITSNIFIKSFHNSLLTSKTYKQLNSPAKTNCTVIQRHSP